MSQASSFAFEAPMGDAHGHTVLSEERKARTLHALEQIDKSLAHEVFGDDEPGSNVLARPVDVKVPRTKSREEVAATRMSALYRGYVARKQFTSLLYSKYVKEDAAISDKETRRLQEGMALLDTLQVLKDIEESKYRERRRRLTRQWSAIRIQRAFKHMIAVRKRRQSEAIRKNSRAGDVSVVEQLIAAVSGPANTTILPFDLNRPRSASDAGFYNQLQSWSVEKLRKRAQHLATLINARSKELMTRMAERGQLQSEVDFSKELINQLLDRLDRLEKADQQKKAHESKLTKKMNLNNLLSSMAKMNPLPGLAHQSPGPSTHNQQ
eukprot:GILK01006924.1.p1 GENE.GILK01006924.1~~GILK01006924.1.p1  ORF type:complete len:324 (+),score=55.65 GILK01006924.1:42-1013(+)